MVQSGPGWLSGPGWAVWSGLGCLERATGPGLCCPGYLPAGTGLALISLLMRPCGPGSGATRGRGPAAAGRPVVQTRFLDRGLFCGVPNRVKPLPSRTFRAPPLDVSTSVDGVVRAAPVRVSFAGALRRGKCSKTRAITLRNARALKPPSETSAKNLPWDDQFPGMRGCPG